MNKQEALKKIEKLDGLTIKDKDFNFAIEMIPKGEALEIVEQLDEPEKTVVPKFVADWYEKNEYSLERNIYTLCIRSYQRELPKEEFSKWFDDVRNKAIETLVKMKLYGYEVKKEKLYTVELPSPNCQTDDHYILSRLKNGKIIVNRYCIEQWEKFGDCQLTEAEIKQDFEWAWQFAKEVDE
jgi:hypothetical protein